LKKGEAEEGIRREIVRGKEKELKKDKRRI